MIYVGIDVASKKHDCYIACASNLDQGQLLVIKNDSNGFDALINCIHNTMIENDDQNVRIGLESTGHYSHNILHHLVREGFDTMLINPLLTNMERKASSVRKTKTDMIDAKSICMFLSRNKEFKPYTIKSYHSSALKSLSRSRITIVKQLTKKKQELHMLVTLVFPEFIGVFSTLHSKASLAILHKYSLPSAIFETRVDGISNTIAKESRKHNSLLFAKKIKELSKHSAGEDNPILGLQIKMCIETIRFLQKQILIYEKEIKKIIDLEYPFVLSIPGVSYVTGGIIIGEIGEIDLFSSPDKLVAFAGLDPCVYQSGNYQASNVKISKRGSSYLRWAIHTSSSIIIHHDNTFKSFYSKKRSEGKHHLVALGHVSKKLSRVIFSILKNHSMFIPQT